MSKINPNGTALIFSSYFGGSSRDYANAIGIDAQNNIYLGGYSFSTNFPVTSNAFDTVFSSSVLYTDAFVLKLNNTGNTLVYSTYLGGKFEDEVKDLVVDSAGYAYLTGYTMSYHFPVTPGSYDVTYPHDTISLPGLEVFVTKMNLTGSGFIYSSFVGGDINSNEMAHAITIDGDGNAYVCGQVISSGTYTFPVTTGAYITSSTSPYGDGFAFKLNNTGTDIIFSSFLGETVGGEAYAIAIDDSLNTYIAGKTYSDDFPTTVNAYDSTYNGSNDIYFVKLNPAGSDALISTFIGGSDQEYCVDIAVDKSQKPYIMGYTRSNDYPYTTGAYDTLFQYNYDSFLTILKADGTDISYSTFLTPGNCTVAGMSIDASNNIYFTGTGNSN